MSRFSRFAITALAVATLALAPAGAALATTLPDDINEDLLDRMQELDVDPAKWDLLLDKIANELPLDSDPDSGVSPISTNSYRIGITDYERSVFPDGSVSLEYFERPTASANGGGGVVPMGISGCSYSYGTGVGSYSNCKIGHANLAYDFYFRASYWQSAYASGVGSVDPYDWKITSTANHCVKDFLGTTGPSSAQIRAYCSMPSGGSSYESVSLHVTTTSATQTSTF